MSITILTNELENLRERIYIYSKDSIKGDILKNLSSIIRGGKTIKEIRIRIITEDVTPEGEIWRHEKIQKREITIIQEYPSG